MKYPAVVWDLDGTLTDSAPGIMHSIAYALHSMQRHVPDTDILRKFLGPPLAVSFQQFCGMTHEEAVTAAGHYRDVYNQTAWKDNSVYPGIRALLAALKKNGCYLAVATGKPQRIAQTILDYFDLSSFFETIIGPSENQFYAEKKDAIAAALQDRKDAVMVGDRSMDIDGAKAYGIPCIAVEYGYATKEEFDAHQPDFRAASVDDLYALLGIEKEEGKGYFISVEGNDGCGKSTQVDMLVDRLTRCGFDVYKTREPGGSPISEKIRQIVLDKENAAMYSMTEALLFAAARAQHVREVIQPRLGNGQIVVTDRFVDSSIAYQGAGQQLGEDLVAEINAPAVDGCYPDTTVYLDIDYHTAMLRREQATEVDRIELFEDAFHERVQTAFRTMQKNNPQRYLHVDANGSIEEIAEQVFASTLARMKKNGLK